MMIVVIMWRLLMEMKLHCSIFSSRAKRKNTTPELNKPFIFYGIQKVVPNDGVILVYTKRDQNKRLLFLKMKNMA